MTTTRTRDAPHQERVGRTGFIHALQPTYKSSCAPATDVFFLLFLLRFLLLLLERREPPAGRRSMLPSMSCIFCMNFFSSLRSPYESPFSSSISIMPSAIFWSFSPSTMVLPCLTSLLATKAFVAMVAGKRWADTSQRADLGSRSRERRACVLGKGERARGGRAHLNLTYIKPSIVILVEPFHPGRDYLIVRWPPRWLLLGLGTIPRTALRHVLAEHGGGEAEKQQRGSIMLHHGGNGSPVKS